MVLSTNTSAIDVHVDTATSTHQVVAYPRTYSSEVHYEGYQIRGACWPPADRRMKQGTQAYIQMFKGSKPETLPNSFDAARLISHFGAPP